MHPLSRKSSQRISVTLDKFVHEIIALFMMSCFYFYFLSQVFITQILTNTTDFKDLFVSDIILTNINVHPLNLHICEKRSPPGFSLYLLL